MATKNTTASPLRSFLNSSLSGDTCALFGVLSNSLKSGVSGMLLRTHRPTATSTMLQMNGMRQPPESRNSLPFMVST
ncbi:hypothetical protein D3C79_902330 [compost metagenome]